MSEFLGKKRLKIGSHELDRYHGVKKRVISRGGCHLLPWGSLLVARVDKNPRLQLGILIPKVFDKCHGIDVKLELWRVLLPERTAFENVPGQVSRYACLLLRKLQHLVYRLDNRAVTPGVDVVLEQRDVELGQMPPLGEVKKLLEL
jgi:hypothetical protein